MVGVGVVLRVTGILGKTDARPLNAVIIYAGLPAFVFRAIQGARIGPMTGVVVLVAWVAFLLSVGFAFAVQVRLRLPRERAGGFLLASALGNTGYLGYPLVAAWLGASAVPDAVFSDVFGTVFALVLVGLPIAARFGTHTEGYPHPLREIVTFPAVIALALGLVSRTLVLPDLVSSGLDLLASMVAPLIMISVGLSLGFRAVSGAAVPLMAVVLIKLLVSPLIAIGMGSLLLGGDQFRVAVLEAGMPSMMLSYVVGERFGLDTEFIAAAIFITTLVSVLSVPLLQWATAM
jgi:predicted permease